MCDPSLNFVASILICSKEQATFFIYLISIHLFRAFVCLLQKAFSTVNLIASDVLRNVSVRFLKYTLAFYRFASMPNTFTVISEFNYAAFYMYFLLLTYMFLQNTGVCLQPHFLQKKWTDILSLFWKLILWFFGDRLLLALPSFKMFFVLNDCTLFAFHFSLPNNLCHLLARIVGTTKASWCD